MMIQLAMHEHDRQVENRRDRVLPDGQQTLSDALEDIVQISGIEVDTEAALPDKEAQRLHDEVQRHLTTSEYQHYSARDEESLAASRNAPDVVTSGMRVTEL
ncbi:hypothetical protein ACFQL0_10205 [Haloplanus litoreus]|uniref:hypothetical protein n=1 Tax=Haloplanus litoreus TaxID=767515 RepID=UPI0036114CF6